MTLRRVSVRVPQDRAEEARAQMLAIAPEGFEERDVEGGIELVLYTGAAGEADARAAFGDVLTSEVEAGWEDRWRSFHRPVEAGGVWIGPPWERAPDGRLAVVIDPGLAFGTGAHATTRLCIELLSELERGSVLDVGCGSGVLAIAACRLGFGPVLAVDIDPVAVDVTRANADANGVSLQARVVDGAADRLAPADVVLANIALPVVEGVLAGAQARRAVTSGYLVGERPHAPRWQPLVRRGLDGWAADVLAR
jgi:ribosomal protein L11 methyltransferase